MYISRFQLFNYKSYYKPEALEFTPGINVITGQNNAGKTALLEALSLNFSGNPHRSYRVLPKPNKQLDPETRVEIELNLTGEEAREILESTGGEYFPYHYVPLPKVGTDFANKLGIKTYTSSSIELICNWLFSQPALTFRLQLKVEGNEKRWRTSRVPSYGFYNEVERLGKFTFGVGGMLKIEGGDGGFATEIELGVEIGQSLSKSVYCFRAERVPEGFCRIGSSTVLNRDARNLAEVLDNIKSTPGKFEMLNELVRQVLPQVKRVSTRKVYESSVETIVWLHDRLDRLDLAIPLQESGTGIGQVLAIIYVIVSSETPRTILIDEPQSFLHPGAVHKLVELLKQNEDHQFIISTHSPAIISATNPKTITLVKYLDGESRAEQIDAARADRMREYLADVGARLSDVFGADRILWVEGQTEEICFQLIIEKMLRQPLMGTAIVGILHTSDLENRDANKVFEIYQRLCEGASLIPPALGFVLDMEDRTEEKRKDIERRSKGLIHFLSRRMYENYLLHPAAIASVINAFDESRDSEITDTVIWEWLNSAKDKSNYNHPKQKGESWQIYVRGDLMLYHLFSDLTQTRVSFEKTTHSAALTNWLIDNEPAQLQEIAGLLQDLLSDV